MRMRKQLYSDIEEEFGFYDLYIIDSRASVPNLRPVGHMPCLLGPVLAFEFDMIAAEEDARIVVKRGQIGETWPTFLILILTMSFSICKT